MFSCGVGGVRTTFAMVAACLVRRKQLIDRGLADPYAVKVPGIGSPTGSSTVSISTFSLRSSCLSLLLDSW